MPKIAAAICTIGLLAGCTVEQPAIEQASPEARPSPAPPTALSPPPPAECAVRGPVRDGNFIARIQSEVEALMTRLKADPNFGWAAYEHMPCYRLVLAFTDGQPRPWVLAAASPELRPLIAFADAKYSHAEREQATREILTALEATRVRFLLAVNGRDARFEVIVRTEADAALVRQVIPQRYREDVIVKLGYVERQPER
jgi:hypothetical protein